jgi:hypothetical protein
MAWLVGFVFGLIAAAIHLLLPEQGLTFLWVMIATMILGFWERQAPWRWVILVVPFIPIADFVHKFLQSEQETRASLWGALLMVLPAIAGSYGGSFMRLAMQNLFKKNQG